MTKPRGRPKTGTTPLRNVRIADDLWDAAKAAAAHRGETVTDVIERALRDYVGAPDPGVSKETEP
jgi:predicted HicB family RNase H-like nuclease